MKKKKNQKEKLCIPYPVSLNYKKMWNTLKAESGGRWCQPHPTSRELMTIRELMENMEKREEKYLDDK